LSQAQVARIVVPESVQQFVAAAGVLLLDAALMVLGLYLSYVARFGRLDKATLSNIVFASTLSVTIKISVLIVCGTYRRRWSIRSKEDSGLVLKASGLASIVLTVVLLVFSKSRAIPPSVLLLDAILTSCLLVLCRASTIIFEKVLGKPKS